MLRLQDPQLSMKFLKSVFILPAEGDRTARVPWLAVLHYFRLRIHVSGEVDTSLCPAPTPSRCWSFAHDDRSRCIVHMLLGRLVSGARGLPSPALTNLTRHRLSAITGTNWHLFSTNSGHVIHVWLACLFLLPLKASSRYRSLYTEERTCSQVIKVFLKIDIVARSTSHNANEGHITFFLHKDTYQHGFFFRNLFLNKNVNKQT